MTKKHHRLAFTVTPPVSAASFMSVERQTTPGIRTCPFASGAKSKDALQDNPSVCAISGSVHYGLRLSTICFLTRELILYT